MVLVLQPKQHGATRDLINAVTAVIALGSLLRAGDVDPGEYKPTEASEPLVAPFVNHVPGWLGVQEEVTLQVAQALCPWPGVVTLRDLPPTHNLCVQDLLRRLSRPGEWSPGAAPRAPSEDRASPAHPGGEEAGPGVEEGDGADDEGDAPHGLPVPGTSPLHMCRAALFRACACVYVPCARLCEFFLRVCVWRGVMG